MNEIDNQTLSFKVNFAIELYNHEKYIESKLQFDYILENYKFDFPETYVAYANCLIKLNEIDKAKEFFQKAYELKSDLNDALIGLGKCYFEEENYKKAEECYAKVLENDNSLVVATFLAYVYEKQERYEEAENLYLTILQIDSNFYDVWNSLALFYKNRLAKTSAIIAHKEAIKVEDNFKHLKNYAITLQDFNELKKALVICRKLLKIDDKDSEVYNIIGVIYQKLFDKENSLNYFEKALELNPKNYETMFNYALALFMFGEYKKGFKVYENRWLSPNFTDVKKHYPSKKEYKGETLEDRSLLVFAEQGFGDTIQFARFLKVLKEKSKAKLIFQCHKSLVELFKNYEFLDEVISLDESIEFDAYLALMDIPSIFEFEKEHIEKNFTALELEDKKSIEKSDKLKVGLTWRGNPKQGNDFNRSMNLENLKDLFTLENIEFYSLQVDEKSKEELKSFPNIIDLSSKLKDFNDTAKIINEMDLVISVDTATAHLSGTLNKKTFVMLSYLGEWRWGIGEKKSIWYPSCKVFKQNRFQNWDNVVSEIKKELE